MIRRGEIYEVSFDPAVGREQAGLRPALVVSADFVNARPLVVTVMPGTDGRNARRNYPTNVRIRPAESGLPRETVFLGFQLRALDHRRFSARPWGRLSPARMAEVDIVLQRVLALRNPRGNPQRSGPG